MTNGNGTKTVERLNANSRTFVEGPNRAVARSYFKAIGMSDADLAKPIIGIANPWTEIGPCNWHLRRLAAKVREGIKVAGGTPLEFNTISISDGITMGTEGMKASVVSREMIVDRIELVRRANYFVAIIALVGCDKTIPGAVMGLIRLDIPGMVLYGGSIAAGNFRGRDVTVGDMFEAVGAFAKGKISAEDLYELENVVCPGPGACGGQFTANTMATAIEVMGIAPMGLSGIPAMDSEKDASSLTAGQMMMDLLAKDIRPSQIITRESIENAIITVAATGGSTNHVPPTLAFAREAGIPHTLDDIEEFSPETPLLSPIKPRRRLPSPHIYPAG